ncbi:MAG: hypothetical protein AAF569_06805, partial [Pseudomonadota bacterium]
NSQDYYNPNSPTDKSCHIYDIAGGNINFRIIEDYSTQISGRIRIVGVGDDCLDCAELTLALGTYTTSTLGLIPKNVCISINDKLGITNDGGDPPDDAIGAGSAFSHFEGTYVSGGSRVGNSDPDLEGQTAACYMETVNGRYIYYQVLIAR